MIVAVRSTVFLMLLLAANGCGLWRQSAAPVVMRATAIMKNREGAEIGRATLLTVTSGVQISGSLSGIGGGTHGIHVHTLGSCSPDFGAAGPHWNPDGKQHGLRNPLGPHGGDLPNLNVPANGSVTFDIVVPNATLRGGSRPMLDSDGASLVVHAFADDYLTDPSGNSGDRIACGVIVAS
jgi:Cu-Zn family superoxide dismutase